MALDSNYKIRIIKHILTTENKDNDRDVMISMLKKISTIAHSDNEFVSYPCLYCGKVFCTIPRLEAHIRESQ